jgi:ankyrin repeat protein
MPWHRPRILNQREVEYFRAVRQGNITKVIDFIQNGIHVETDSDEGETALHIASRKGYVDIVKYLITECHCDVQATST